MYTMYTPQKGAGLERGGPSEDQTYEPGSKCERWDWTFPPSKTFRMSTIGDLFLALTHLHRQVALISEFLDLMHLRFEKIHVLFFVFQQGHEKIT